MDYYINMLAYYGLTQGPENIPNIASAVVQQIQQSKILLDAAAALDPPVTVSDDEVNKVIKERKLSSDRTRMDAIRSELLINKLRTEHFDKLVPQTGEQRALLAMFLESQTEADNIIARLDKGEKFSDLAASLSLENQSKTKSGDFGYLPKGILPTILGDTLVEDKAFSPDTVANMPVTVKDAERDKTVGYWLLKVTEAKDEGNARQLHLFAMLLSSKEEADSIKSQLDAGSDFAELAKASSQYGDVATDGGDQKFVIKGGMPKAVDDVIFGEQGLEINKVSTPITDTAQTTKGGVWLLQVTGIDPDKTIESTQRDTLISIEMNNWADKVITDNQDKVETTLTQDKIQYAVAKAQAR
jgi:parvulin-like peptidyl-prolyl isomerase